MKEYSYAGIDTGPGGKNKISERDTVAHSFGKFVLEHLYASKMDWNAWCILTLSIRVESISYPSITQM